MSHLHEREEKICLNCNAAIYGRYCHVCGQENIEPKESFWHLASHFIADLFHYDGKFLKTIKYLLFRPGFLAKEHLRGRRADYLHPIRLYIFVSAFFFLIVFGFYTKHKASHFEDKTSEHYIKITQDLKEDKAAKVALLSSKDNTVINKERIQNKIIWIDSAIVLLQKDTTAKEQALLYAEYGNEWQEYYWQKRMTKQTYLDSQNKLPLEKRDGFFKKKEHLVNIAIEEKAKQQNITSGEAILDMLLHNIPKGLFISLPVYALILFIIYYRNKKYTYVSHLIFSIHLFCFTFLLILSSMWFNSLFTVLHIKLNNYISLVAFIIAMLYTYKGLRNFYEQRRAKTIAKFLILSFSCILIALLVFTIAFSISALTA